MMVCLDCESLFERGRAITERHGLDTPPYEEQLVCPRCFSTSICPTNRCDLCGEWIIGNYIRTADGNRICDGCYIIRNVDDE